ncbi:hypothetical protein SUGI_0014320 [Cryptomeria japonica]|nr:hypothetical protein SUGI_0014320 [Cryptomeria japonica]
MPGRICGVKRITLIPNGFPDVLATMLRAELVKWFAEALLGLIQGSPFIRVVGDEVSAMQKSCNWSGSALSLGTKSNRKSVVEESNAVKEAIGFSKRL